MFVIAWNEINFNETFFAKIAAKLAWFASDLQFDNRKTIDVLSNFFLLLHQYAFLYIFMYI